MQSPPDRPFVVTVVPERPVEARVTTVSDVLVGAVSMAGLLLGAALILGVLFGGLRVAFRRYYPSGPDHMPPVKPFESDETQRPS